MLGFYHYSYAIIYSIGTSKMIMQTNIDWQLLTGSNIPFFPFMFILLPVTWLIVGFSNFSSKAIVPRWSIVVNPVILTIILSIVTWIIPKTECLLPGIFSLGITLYYIICWISLKKDRNLCLKRKFSNWWHRDCGTIYYRLLATLS